MSDTSNRLYYGDNLAVLREHIASESVDLVYLDPPFNSNRAYNVIFARHSTVADPDTAQIQAFGDTWRWTSVTDEQYAALAAGGLPNQVADALTAFRTLLGENDAMAYLVNMAPRLVELHRVLKRTGSLYLHCDPTMSHYLKVLLDSVFGPEHFKSEIVWKRTSSHSGSKKYGPVHDSILFYVKDDQAFTWNQQHQEYSEDYVASKYRFVDNDTGHLYRLSDMTGSGVRQGESGTAWRHFNPTSIGRHWAIPSYCDWKYHQLMGETLDGLSLVDRLEALDRVGLVKWPDRAGGKPEHKRYLEDMPGVTLQDVWTDIDPINARAAERLGYPTQKPLALLDRITAASSNEGDVVLDPFCGCGTTIDSAIRLNRRWIGIDITYIAVDLIEKRLRHTFGDSIIGTYVVSGIPRDIGGAQALFERSPFDFERWAVSLIDAQPNAKQVGDKGIDGVVRFPVDNKGGIGRVLVSVKGGKTVGPQFVRDLLGTVETQKAQMGVLITMVSPTRGVLDAVDHGGTYTLPVNGQTFPRIQIITAPDLLKGERPKMPHAILPYIAANRRAATSGQLLFDA